jgi:S-adenosylmethionine-diacylglycerol 3-amino-3-carboxypropyl transferase
LPPVHSEVLEDEEPIRAWLRAGPGDVVVCIASAGDNVFHLALDQPAKVYGVDISPAQIAFCQIKSAALDSLSAADLADVMGTWPGPCAGRGDLLTEALSLAGADLPADDARFLAAERGLLHIGRFDQLVGVVRDQVHQAVGTDVIRRVITEPARHARVKMWEENDLSRVLAPAFNEFFHEDVLDDIFTPRQHRASLACTPFPEHLLRVVRQLVTDARPDQNYYLHRWALGGYLPGGPVPPYLDPANQPLLRARLATIEWVPAGLPDFLHQLPPGSARCFNLSNVLDWCDDDYAEETWRAITRASAQHARVFARSFLLGRAHRHIAASLGWIRDQVAEKACLASERVGYYPVYELWSRVA